MGYMASHMMTQHGWMAEAQRSWRILDTGDEPRTYRMAFLTKGGPQSCPVEGYPGQAATRTEIRLNFLHRHVLVTVVILEEGNIPHPRFIRCNMMFPRWALNGSHPSTAQCARGADCNRQRIAEEELRESSERAFEAYGETLENVTAF